MLILLLILALTAGITFFILQNMIKKNQKGTAYTVLTTIQAACLGALIGILIVLLIKGRILV